MAFFVAFYSYKGGVGRSLALANVGYSLASLGRRVILLDLDLEAPGLQEIPEFSLKGSRAKKGFLDYANSYRKTGQCPKISRYVHPCRESPSLGKLWVMPAGNLGSTYQEQLGDLTWKRLHPEKGTEPFVEELRGDLVKEFSPDYVLIDARTGLSDIGGLSTHRLADMVVLLFNLTPTAIEGSVRAYRSFVSEGSRVRSIQLVASPIPPLIPGADSITESRLRQAEDLMPLGTAYGRLLVRIDYDPAIVFSEVLAVRRPDLFPSSNRYETLRETVQRANPAEALPTLEQARSLQKEGLITEAIHLLESFTIRYPNNLEASLALGDLLLVTGRAAEALHIFERVRDFYPSFPFAHRRLGEALTVLNQIPDAIVSLSKASELGDKSTKLYLALLSAHTKHSDTPKQIAAREQAIISILSPYERYPAGLDSVLTAEDFTQKLDQRLPFAEFKASTFWDDVMSSLSVSQSTKLQTINQVFTGKLPAEEIGLLSQIFSAERLSWTESLGQSARSLQRRVAETTLDPKSPEQLLESLQGDAEDAALLTFSAITDETIPLDRQIELLETACGIAPSEPAMTKILGTLLLRKSQELPGTHRQALRARAKHLLNQASSLGAKKNIEPVNSRRALLIGIDHYAKIAFSPRGSVNDLYLMEHVLLHFGFPKENICILANQDATREGILDALEQLQENTKPENAVVIFYSGHGSQMTDREGDEPDGLDETIVPYDSGRAPHPNRDITDDELYIRLQNLAAITPNITVILDCSHSGTMTSDPIRRGERQAPPELRPIEMLPPSPIRWTSLEDPSTLGSSGWFPISDRHTMIAACKSYEGSFEIQLPDNLYHGALTYFLSRELLENGYRRNLRDMFETVAAQVTRHFPDQHPQLEGLTERERVFDPTPSPLGAKILAIVSERSRNSVALHLLTESKLKPDIDYPIYSYTEQDVYLGDIKIASVNSSIGKGEIMIETFPGSINPPSRIILDLMNVRH